MALKYLIAFGLLSSGIQPEMDSDGWVTLPRPEKEVISDGSDERDPSIWVVYSKELESEKILVSFPGEPKYRYMDDKGELLEAYSLSGGCEYRLQVMKKGSVDAEGLMEARQRDIFGAVIVSQSVDEEGKWVEFVYTKGGFWFKERYVTTEDQIYFFQTKSSDATGEEYVKFVDSLDIQQKIRR